MPMSEELFYHLLDRVEKLEGLLDEQTMTGVHHGHLGSADACEVRRCVEERKELETARRDRREDATKLWLGQKL